jgi:hypothetical protein
MNWISVKDRLPDFGKEYIFFTGKQEVTVGSVFAHEEAGGYAWISDSLSEKIEIARYWMELPKPPEDKEGTG